MATSGRRGAQARTQFPDLLVLGCTGHQIPRFGSHPGWMFLAALVDVLITWTPQDIGALLACPRLDVVALFHWLALFAFIGAITVIIRCFLLIVSPPTPAT